MCIKKIKQKIIWLVIGATIVSAGFGGNYIYDEVKIEKFKNDLMEFNVNEESSRSISEYFQGKDRIDHNGIKRDPYLTIEERDEYIRAINEAKKQLRVTEWGPVELNKDLIRNFNLVIREAAEERRIEKLIK